MPPTMNVRTPYQYVQMESVIADVKGLLTLGQSLSGTGSTSVTIMQKYYRSDSLLKLRGLGKEIWKGSNPQQYIDQLRDEWK
jgi:hypothetical protein